MTQIALAAHTGSAEQTPLATSGVQSGPGHNVARPRWKRVFMTVGWVLLLLVPFVSIWALLRPYWNKRPSSRAKWLSALSVVAALALYSLHSLDVIVIDALAGTLGFVAWFAWVYLTWRTTEKLAPVQP